MKQAEVQLIQHNSTKNTLTRLVVDLCENVLDGLVVVFVLWLEVGRRVAPLAAPLNHLSGLWGREGLQAWRAVQHVLDGALHCHRSLKLQQDRHHFNAKQSLTNHLHLCTYCLFDSA